MEASRVKNLSPYIPGEQVKDKDYIKLNANENPYPPSPRVLSDLKKILSEDAKKISLYPDPDSFDLREAISDMLNKTGGVLSRSTIEKTESSKIDISKTRTDSTKASEKILPSKNDALPFKITSDMIYTGNGSDEVLSFIFYAFFDNRVPLIMSEHTYSFYPVYCGFYGIPSKVLPLKKNFQLDVDLIVKDAKKNNSPVILANPNAPTGLCLQRQTIRSMLESLSKENAFVVDEAYVDFGGESCISLLNEFPNLIIVRTFSKSMSGAGLRLGYLVANPCVVKTVTKVKNSLNHFPVDFLAQRAGISICENVSYYIENAKKIVSTREHFCKFLKSKNFSFNESSANFVFVKKQGIGGKEIYNFVKENGILIRHFQKKGIEDYVRISIGTDEQMEKLCKILERL